MCARMCWPASGQMVIELTCIPGSTCKCHRVDCTIIPTQVSQKPHDEQRKDALQTMCCFAPSISILKAATGNCLRQCEDFGEDVACSFLVEQYVERVSRQVLTTWRIPTKVVRQDSPWYCNAWDGLHSTSPGCQCGTQNTEALHAAWERVRKSLGGRESVGIFPGHNAAFISGNEEQGSILEKNDVSGTTIVAVSNALSGDLPPCTQHLDVDLATLGVHMICSGNDELHKLLFNSGIYTHPSPHSCRKGCF